MTSLARLLTTFLSATCFAAIAEPESTIRPSDPSLVAQGRFIYEKNCVPCHGVRGDGTGEMGLTVNPRPRNFTTGIFKFRSTPSGALPTDDDLRRTIRGGLTGTAMPSFDALPERDIRAAAEYVKTFSRKWLQSENYAAPVTLPRMPTWFSDEEELNARMIHGKALFVATCAPCHGENGAGNGPAATNGLTDVWGNATTPSDLRQPQLRCGREWRDIYRVLVTGLNGTPMPSFVDSTTEEQRWEIIAYIERLRRDLRRDRLPITK